MINLSFNESEFLFLHRYLYGGGTTFTAHLLYKLRPQTSRRLVFRCTRRSEGILRDFGYGISYQNISAELLKSIKKPFLTIFKDNFLHILPKLNEGKNPNDIVLVIHDHRDVSHTIIPYIKTWKLITIRKTVQSYLKNKYDLDSFFKPHPFYAYPVFNGKYRKGAISISRISFEKNTDMIIKANKQLGANQEIRIFGCPSRLYVHLLADMREEYNRYYYGKFGKSFSILSQILAQAKFVVDLSTLNHDGGGSQYTFLEAIHNGCALILHRKWIENESVPLKYSDFREDHNCFAVENQNELVDLIRKNPDVERINMNARKILKRHIEVDWSDILKNATK